MSGPITKKSFLTELKKNKILFLMLIPVVVYFIAFNYLPMGGVVLAFKQFNYMDGIFKSPWNGFKNFEFLFKSGTLLNITYNTIRYNLIFYTVGTIIEITTAILFSEMNSKFIKKFFQSIMFFPYFVSFVLVGAIIYNLLNYEFGLLNSVIKTFGGEPIDVYSKPKLWKFILTATSVWKWTGYSSIIYLAILTNIDPSLYEAASIDGANKIKTIRHITLPLLKPTVIILSLMFVSRILRGQFDLFYNVIGDNAQLFRETDIIDIFVFRSLTKQLNIGLGSAAGFYQSSFGLVIILLVNSLTRKLSPENALF